MARLSPAQRAHLTQPCSFRPQQTPHVARLLLRGTCRATDWRGPRQHLLSWRRKRHLLQEALLDHPSQLPALHSSHTITSPLPSPRVLSAAVVLLITNTHNRYLSNVSILCLFAVGQGLEHVVPGRRALGVLLDRSTRTVRDSVCQVRSHARIRQGVLRAACLLPPRILSFSAGTLSPPSHTRSALPPSSLGLVCAVP